MTDTKNGTTHATKAASAKLPGNTKSDAVIQLLRRRDGATIDEMVTATGWKPHSCRAFLTGVRKSDVSLIKEERSDGKTAYRIALPAEAAA